MGFFSRLVSGLKNTKKSFSEKLKFVFTGNDIDESFFDKLRDDISINDDDTQNKYEDILIRAKQRDEDMEEEVSFDNKDENITFE